jgi:hypothetical protein
MVPNSKPAPENSEGLCLLKKKINTNTQSGNMATNKATMPGDVLNGVRNASTPRQTIKCPK